MKPYRVQCFSEEKGEWIDLDDNRYARYEDALSAMAFASHAAPARVYPRALSRLAWLVRQSWPRPYFGAVPYIEAMTEMCSVNDNYGLDTGRDIVMRFLANGASYRGKSWGVGKNAESPSAIRNGLKCLVGVAPAKPRKKKGAAA